jgi:hypothetical protein
MFDVIVNGIEQSGCWIAGSREGGGCVGLLGGNESALLLPNHDIYVSESWYGDVSIAVFVDLPPGFTLTAPVPEPSTWAMMLIGFVALGFVSYRKRLLQNAPLWPLGRADWRRARRDGSMPMSARYSLR